MAPRFILTDIEGTTTDIQFVHNVLFPYAAAHLPDYVRRCADQPDVRACLDEVTLTMRDADLAPPGLPAIDDEAAIEELLRWIRDDRKLTPLKTLQGFIWKDGYEKGAYQAHIYNDVPAALQAWRALGIGLGVYSSGSVAAQQLLFGHSNQGDLTSYFSHYFDTRIGAKQDPQSYAKIAAALELRPIEILFLSDIPAELDAAAQVGYQVVQLRRSPQAQPSQYPAVESFADIQLDAAGAIC